MAFEAKDVVTRLQPDSTGCLIQLGTQKAGRFTSEMEPRPLDRMFLLKLDHPNYDSLFQVAMHASFLERTLVIRTREDIDSSKIAEVDYLYVLFEDD